MKAIGLSLILLGIAASAFAGTAPGVPEIDGGSAVSAVTVIAGSVLILRARRKK